MIRWSALLAGVVVLFAFQFVEEAEAQVYFGPQVVVWDFEELGIGARLDVGLADAFGIDEGFFDELFATSNLNYVFLEGDGTPLLFNANAAVPLDVEAAVRPYVGTGVNHFRYSFEGVTVSNSGLNLLGGLFFGLGEVPAFAELQYSTTGSGFLSLSGGVLFGG